MRTSLSISNVKMDLALRSGGLSTILTEVLALHLVMVAVVAIAIASSPRQSKLRRESEVLNEEKLGDLEHDLVFESYSQEFFRWSLLNGCSENISGSVPAVIVVRTVLARLSTDDVVQVLVSDPELSVRECPYFFLPRVLSPLRCLIQVNMFLPWVGLLLVSKCVSASG